MSQFVTCLVLVVLSHLSPGPGLIIVISGQGQKTNIKILEACRDGQCASAEERERARNEIHQITNSAIAATVALSTMPIETITYDSTTITTDMSTTATLSTTTADSTSTMPSTTTSATTMPSMYTCNGTPGWRHVAFINMTDTSYNCPTGLNLTSYSKRTCGRSHTTIGGCSSTTFSVGGLPYSRVCGRIRGYQFGGTDAFYRSTQGIDSYYVDGVSLTYGGAGSQQHIWTFATGLTEVDTNFLSNRCPCDTHNYDRVPAFVGDNYFCESGYTLPGPALVSTYSTPMMFSGMVRTVHPTAYAVSSTTLHGLQRT